MYQPRRTALREITSSKGKSKTTKLKKNKDGLVGSRSCRSVKSHASIRLDDCVKDADSPMVSECNRLSIELERVLIDHQRQSDEIVALRALARSLKEEIEEIDQNRTNDNEHRYRRSKSFHQQTEPRAHEFFELDAQMDALRAENERLQNLLEETMQERDQLQIVVETDLPRYEILSVQATASLQSVTSQLHDEQKENDRLRAELSHYQAYSAGMRPSSSQNTVGSMKQPTKEEEKEMDDLQSATCQMQSDLRMLESELKRLHRALDESDGVKK